MVEEVLEVLIAARTLGCSTATAALALVFLVALVVIRTGLRVGWDHLAHFGLGSLLGKSFGADVHNSRTDFFGDLRKLVRQVDWIRDRQRRGVGTVDLPLASMNAMCRYGADEDAGRKGREDREGRGETAQFQPFNKRIHSRI